jgi:hypothetical protein
VEYTVTVRNNDTGCGTSSFSHQTVVPQSWTASYVCSGMSLAEGASVSMKFRVAAPTSAGAGNYAVASGAANSAVPSYAATSPATFVVSPPPGGGTPGGPGSFTDAFDRPNGPTLGNGWTSVSGSLGIGAGQAQNAATRAMHLAVQSALVGKTQSVSASFTSTSNNLGPKFGVAVRYKDAKNYYACYRMTGGSSVLRIVRVVNGVEIVLKQATLANPALNKPFTLACQASGTTLTLGLDGSTKATASDTAFSTGSAGMFVGYTGTGAGHVQRADNFSASVQ